MFRYRLAGIPGDIRHHNPFFPTKPHVNIVVAGRRQYNTFQFRQYIQLGFAQSDFVRHRNRGSAQPIKHAVAVGRIIISPFVDEVGFSKGDGYGAAVQKDDGFHDFRL